MIIVLLYVLPLLIVFLAYIAILLILRKDKYKYKYDKYSDVVFVKNVCLFGAIIPLFNLILALTIIVLMLSITFQAVFRVNK